MPLVVASPLMPRKQAVLSVQPSKAPCSVISYICSALCIALGPPSSGKFEPLGYQLP